jgi:protein phosphatase
MRLRSAAQTNVGRVRENNEDSVHLWASERYALAVVADGMGGAAAGEEASRMAVEAIEDNLILPAPNNDTVLTDLTENAIIEKLAQAIRVGNANILTRIAAQPELKGMGTTVTLAFVRVGRAVIAHVGDSRAYLIDRRANQIHQITADHSYIDLLIAAGQITEQQAEDHPLRNVLYRALGQNDQIDIDVYDSIKLHPGDRLLLCSDGLTRHVRADEIARIVLDHDAPEAACAALIDRANERGGEDNISVVVIAIDPDENAAQDRALGDESTLDLKKLRFDDEDTLRFNDSLLKRRPQ